MLPALETPIPLLAVLGVAAYLIGSLPIGRIVYTRVRFLWMGHRSNERSAALTKVLADQLKGFGTVVTVAQIGGQDAAQLAVLLVYLGHMLPIWRRSDGSMGIGTLLGALTGLNPFIGLIALIIWLATFFMYRYATLAAVSAALATPLVVMTYGHKDCLVLLFALTIIVLVCHGSRIKRLASGQEPVVDWRQIAAQKALSKRLANRLGAKQGTKG